MLNAKFTYFISFAWSVKGATNRMLGNVIDDEINKEINTTDDLRILEEEIRKTIQEKTGQNVDSVIILNYKCLNEERS